MRRDNPPNIQRTTYRRAAYRSVRTGRLVSKAYAARYPHLSRRVVQYRSRATGWIIPKQRVSKFLSVQKRRELLHSRIFKGRGHRTKKGKAYFARTLKQRKGALALLEQVSILTGRQIKQLIGQSPSLEQYLRWALDHADLLEMSRSERRAMTDALRS